jgi:hypothetical protein
MNLFKINVLLLCLVAFNGCTVNGFEGQIHNVKTAGAILRYPVRVSLPDNVIVNDFFYFVSKRSENQGMPGSGYMGYPIGPLLLDETPEAGAARIVGQETGLFFNFSSAPFVNVIREKDGEVDRISMDETPEWIHLVKQNTGDSLTSSGRSFVDVRREKTYEHEIIFVLDISHEQAKKIGGYCASLRGFVRKDEFLDTVELRGEMYTYYQINARNLLVQRFHQGPANAIVQRHEPIFIWSDLLEGISVANNRGLL